MNVFATIAGYIVRLIDNVIADIIMFSLLVILLIYDTVKNIKFSKRTFVCLMCEHNFKMKWYRLSLISWRLPRKYRTYKELNGEECERVNHVRCPECKICNCAVKADE